MSSSTQKNYGLYKGVIVVITLLVCSLIYYGFFVSAVHKQNGYKTFSKETTLLSYPFSNPRQILNLGWVHKIHYGLSNTSYLNYDTIKKPGVFRIGIFGCSFSEAFDVTGDYDFATLLQKKYISGGHSNVEVISFGTGGYGLGQMLMLYEYAGKKYNLDMVVVNSFFMYHFPRDLSFRLYNNYGPIHARYVVELDSIRLIEYPENNLTEAYKGYYTLFPNKIYRKYDYKPTGAFLPMGLKYNPLYYRNGTNSQLALINETNELYAGLLKKFAAQAKQLIVVCNDEHSYALKEDFASDKNVSFYQSNYYRVREKSASLYTSTTWHNSPLGNKFYADELYSFIKGNATLNSYLRFEAPYHYTDTTTINFDSLGLKIGATVIHQLYRAAETEISDEDWNREPDYADAVALTKSNFSNLLLLNQSLNDLTFINMPRTALSGDTVKIHVHYDGVKATIPIGRIEQRAPHVFSISLFRNKFTEQQCFLVFKKNFNSMLTDFRLLFLKSASTPKVFFTIGPNKFSTHMQAVSARLTSRQDVFETNIDGVDYLLNETFPDKTLLSTPAFAPKFNQDLMRCRMNGTAYIEPDSINETQSNFNLVVYRQHSFTEYPFLKIVTDTLP